MLVPAELGTKVRKRLLRSLLGFPFCQDFGEQFLYADQELSRKQPRFHVYTTNLGTLSLKLTVK